MLKNIMKMGRLGSTLFITLSSILASVVITLTIIKTFGTYDLHIVIAISIIAPLIIASIVSWNTVGWLMKINDLEEQQRKLATFDSLTGLMMRRVYFGTCKILLNKAKISGDSMSLAYIDIDDFKKINDSYGHAVGDEVLKSFSTGLSNSLRESDVAARIGGEEFSITLPSTDLRGAMHLLEKIRLSSERDLVEFRGSKVTYTISIGVSSFEGDSHLDVDDIIKQSDEALFQAKKTGKNRVVQHVASILN